MLVIRDGVSMADIVNMDGSFSYNESSFAKAWKSMGAGVSGDVRPDEVDREFVDSEPDMRNMLKVCEELVTVLLVTDPPTNELQDLAIILLTKLRAIEVPIDRDLLAPGDQNDIIYFLLKGEAHVMSRDHSVALRTVFAPDFFGEVTAIFETPCAAPVSLSPGSELHGVSAREVKQALKSHHLVAMHQLFTRRHYIPTTGTSLDTAAVIRAICLQALRQTVIFHKWCRYGLKALLARFPKHPIIVYPEGADLIRPGDPSGQLLLLVVGRADIYWGDGLVSVEAKREPVVIGEESLVTPEVEQNLTIKATSPCHVIHIQSDWIVDVMEELGQNSSTQEPVASRNAWEATCETWRAASMSRKAGDIFPDVTVEVLCEKLMQTDLFSQCSRQYVYYVAMFGVGGVFPNDHVIMSITKDAPSLIDTCKVCYIIDGEAELMPEGSAKPLPVKKVKSKQTSKGKGNHGRENDNLFFLYKSGSVLYVQDWMSGKSLELRSRGETKVVMLPITVLQQATSLFPKSTLLLKPASSSLSNAMQEHSP